MSLYAEYLTERTNDLIIETDTGFATYRYLDDKVTVYIVDIYTVKEARMTGKAFYLMDLIAEESRAVGCKMLMGTVFTNCKGTTVSTKMLLAYGMRIESSLENCIIFKKDI